MTVLYYQLNRNCHLRKGASLIDLAPLLHHPATRRLLFLGQTGRSPGQKNEPRLEPIRVRIEGGEEPLLVHLDTEESSRRLEWVRRERRRCRECPASRSQHPTPGAEGLLGCIGSLQLPLTRETERAMLNVVEQLLDSSAELEPTVTLPIRYIWDNGLEGEEIRQLRKRGDLFESTEPVEARIGPFLQKQPLNTDQFLSLFLLPGIKQRIYLHMFAPFAAEFVTRATTWEATADSKVLEQFIAYFDALAQASELDVELQVIYLREQDELEVEESQSKPRTETASSPPPPEG